MHCAIRIKEAKATLSHKFAIFMAAFNLVIYGIATASATPIVASAAGGAANSLFDKVGQFSDNFIAQLDDLYCNKLFPLLFIIDLILLAFVSKDDRAKQREQKALWILGAVFVGIKLVGVIQATLVELTTF